MSKKIEEIIKKLEKGNLSEKEIKNLIKEMKTAGLSGEIIAVSDPDSPEAMAAIEYIQYHQYLPRSYFKKKVSKEQVKKAADTLLAKKSGLIDKKTAIILLAHSGDEKALAIFEKHRKNSAPELKLWIKMAIDECKSLLKQKESELPVVRFSKIKTKSKKISFFEKTPFNFCDRWCERCYSKDKCQIFQDVFSERLKHFVKGEDPDDPRIIFQDLKKSFEKTIEMIKSDSEKEGINFQKLEKKIEKQMGRRPKLNEIPLQQMAQRFAIETANLLKKLFFDNEESGEDFIGLEKTLEDFNWYHTLFAAKLYRALVRREEAKNQENKIFKKIDLEDANVSANLAYASLNVCQKSLSEISQKCAGFMAWAKELSVLAKIILERIETEFPNFRKTKIIFHGYN